MSAAYTGEQTQYLSGVWPNSYYTKCWNWSHESRSCRYFVLFRCTILLSLLCRLRSLNRWFNSSKWFWRHHGITMFFSPRLYIIFYPRNQSALTPPLLLTQGTRQMCMHAAYLQGHLVMPALQEGRQVLPTAVLLHQSPVHAKYIRVGVVFARWWQRQSRTRHRVMKVSEKNALECSRSYYRLSS